MQGQVIKVWSLSPPTVVHGVGQSVPLLAFVDKSCIELKSDRILNVLSLRLLVSQYWCADLESEARVAACLVTEMRLCQHG